MGTAGERSGTVQLRQQLLLNLQQTATAAEDSTPEHVPVAYRWAEGGGTVSRSEFSLFWQKAQSYKV